MRIVNMKPEPIRARKTGVYRFVFGKKSRKPLDHRLQLAHGGSHVIGRFFSPDVCQSVAPGYHGVYMVQGTAEDFHRLGINLKREHDRRQLQRKMKGGDGRCLMNS